ncbi:LysM peptidoglycan-binding domain-containing protein [Allosaccharopolyspora coralli]|uniref:LysM peptidoglycan-binding domain-containing protein n=1 Tax=Allosaccharopolyspora coralli TaxID=2665642 RepID=A0A5Q3Q2J1_9PSEU|nr:transglycosylase family protein [Allosaccharopolyspora coralli]QGK68563.1 LysM peptidoglycan-binding domain-containing protein [Allosaccharopolyspora coralli]
MGKHRKTSNASRNLARVAVAGAVVAAPLAVAAPANAADWDELAQCESSGNWSANTGNGFSGGLQFTPSTWAAFGGTQYAANAKDATREQQIAVAEKVLAGQGPGAWPACTSKTNWTSGSTSGGSSTSSSQEETSSSSSSSSESSSSSSESSVKSSGADYTVQTGDTLGKIAKKYGVDYQDVFEQNSDVLSSPHMIFPGQKLDVQ